MSDIPHPHNHVHNHLYQFLVLPPEIISGFSVEHAGESCTSTSITMEYKLIITEFQRTCRIPPA